MDEIPFIMNLPDSMEKNGDYRIFFSKKQTTLRTKNQLKEKCLSFQFEVFIIFGKFKKRVILLYFVDGNNLKKVPNNWRLGWGFFTKF